MTLERPLICTIHCDRPGCGSRITVNHDITEEQAAAMAFAVGWTCDHTEGRWSHRCVKHSEQEGT